MPIYEYFCPACKSRFTLLRPLSQSSEAASCPRCQSKAERVFSSFACSSKSAEGVSTPLGGSSPCSSCSAASCDSCK